MFGKIDNPFATYFTSSPLNNPTPGASLILLFVIFYRVALVVAGLYVLINFITAGYMFLSAGGDSKAVGKAAEKIWVSIVGLLVVAGSLVLAGLIGQLIFGDWSFIIQPKIVTP